MNGTMSINASLALLAVILSLTTIAQAVNEAAKKKPELSPEQLEEQDKHMEVWLKEQIVKAVGAKKREMWTGQNSVMVQDFGGQASTHTFGGFESRTKDARDEDDAVNYGVMHLGKLVFDTQKDLCAKLKVCQGSHKDPREIVVQCSTYCWAKFTKMLKETGMAGAGERYLNCEQIAAVLKVNQARCG